MELFVNNPNVGPPPEQENTKRDAVEDYRYPVCVWAAPLNKDGKFYFAVNYGLQDGTELNKTSRGVVDTICTYFASTYHANLSFINGTEVVDVKVERKYPLNATALDWNYLFAPYDVVPGGDIENTAAFAKSLPDEMVLYTGMPPFPNISISDAYRDSNIRAIADGMSYALGGVILNAGRNRSQHVLFFFETDNTLGTEGAAPVNSLITQTPWVQSEKSWLATVYNFTRLTPSLYEEMLWNVTISMLTRPNTNTTVEVTMSPWENAYSFANKQSLIWAYGVSLVVSAGFIALGIVALGRNGVPAESGGFMQLLCTTTGDNLAINREAATCSMGGSSNFSNELKELRVRYGYIKATAGGEGKPRAGFGTREETDAI